MRMQKMFRYLQKLFRQGPILNLRKYIDFREMFPKKKRTDDSKFQKSIILQRSLLVSPTGFKKIKRIFFRFVSL